MKILSFLLLFLGQATLLQAQSTEQLLQQLDNAVRNAAEFEKKKEAEIARLKGNLRVATLLVDKYLSCKQVAEAYIKFDSDSALVYLRKCYEMGVAQGRREWWEEAVIQQAFVYADRGDMLQSQETLNNLGSIEQVSAQLKTAYAKAALMSLVNFQAPDKPRSAPPYASKRWHAYKAYIPRGSIDDFLFIIISNQPFSPQAMLKQLKRLEPHIVVNSFDDAMYRTILAAVYKHLNKPKKLLHETVRAAIADVHCANHSSAALLNTIILLSKQKGSYERVWNYIELCNHNISIYKDAGRSVALANAQQTLHAEYKRQMHTYIYLWVVVALLFLAVAMVGLVLLVRRKQQLRNWKNHARQQQQEVERLQQCTRELEQQLNTTRQSMHRWQTQAEQTGRVMGNIFALIGTMFADIRKYKRTMANLVQTGSWVEARKIANDSVMKDQAVERLYTRFDEVFLALHPDFIQRFNAMLQPGHQLFPEKAGSLTPELRIYALISIGVTDSVRIAEILQYSPQTVYNYRLRVRHTALPHALTLAQRVECMWSNKAPREATSTS